MNWLHASFLDELEPVKNGWFSSEFYQAQQGPFPD